MVDGCILTITECRGPRNMVTVSEIGLDGISERMPDDSDHGLEGSLDN